MNIVIAGVGGQGTLLASRVLGKYAIEKGLDCKLSEVHGMSQRGGSVITYVKMGEKICSPTIDEGEADVLLAFEKLECIRWEHLLKDNGIIISSSQEIMPMPVICGNMEYPKNIVENLKNALFVDAISIAEEIGNSRVANTVMLGVLCNKLNLDKEVFYNALISSVPQKAVVENEKAFNKGYDIK